MSSIQLRNVVKRYGAVDVVHGIDLDIEQGEFVVLLGPSGCGKTTTLRMIAGLEDVSDGQLSIGDRVVNTVAPKDRGVSMVFQNYALYPHMTVRQNMEFALRPLKLGKSETERRIVETASPARTGRIAGAPAFAAVGRSTPACGHGAGSCANAGSLSVRRTPVQSGCKIADAGPAGDRQASQTAWNHDRLRHSRPGRGHDTRRQDRHHARRPYRAAGHAPGGVHPASQQLCRHIHRKSGDEHGAGCGCRRQAGRRPCQSGDPRPLPGQGAGWPESGVRHQAPGYCPG